MHETLRPRPVSKPSAAPPEASRRAGTTLDTIWRRYTFDRHLRFMVMDAIERVEVALRSALVNDLTLRFGPFTHLDLRAFAGIHPDDHRRLKDDLRQHVHPLPDQRKTHQVGLARSYRVTGKVLFSWLLTLNYVRNLCAHHARLWNRELALKPLIPDAKHDPLLPPSTDCTPKRLAKSPL